MAYEVPGFMIGTLIAAADLSAAQFLCAKVTAANSVNVATVAGEYVIGILQGKPTSGQPADVMVHGVSKAISGAPISAGAKIMTNASGKVITGATAGSHVIGCALEAATGADQVITVLLNAGAGII